MLSSLVLKQIFVLVILRYFVYSQQWESGLRQKYDGYGEDWIFMPDGNGQPQVAVFKIQDNEKRGLLDGSEIAYIIYTRYPIASPNMCISTCYCAVIFCRYLLDLASRNVFKI